MAQARRGREEAAVGGIEVVVPGAHEGKGLKTLTCTSSGRF